MENNNCCKNVEGEQWKEKDSGGSGNNRWKKRDLLYECMDPVHYDTVEYTMLSVPLQNEITTQN